MMIAMMMIIIMMNVMIKNSLFQPGHFSAGSTTDKVTFIQKITVIDNDKMVKNGDDISFQTSLVFLRSLITITVIHWRKTFRNSF